MRRTFILVFTEAGVFIRCCWFKYKYLYMSDSH